MSETQYYDTSFEVAGSPAEQLQGAHFCSLIAGIEFSEVAQFDPTKSIKNKDEVLKRFGLVALTAIHPRPDSMAETGRSWHLGGTDIENRKRTAYLDTGQAIALTYKSKLRAVGSGGINPKGQLKIVQLQAIDDAEHQTPRERFKTGLYDGILWRETLVASWMRVAKEIGVKTMVIQSGHNLKYDHLPLDRRLAGYDAVARRMGFRQNKWMRLLGYDVTRQDWHLPVKT